MRNRYAILAAALLVALLAASPVWAAAPFATGEMDVQVWPEAEPGATAVIVGLTLPPSTKLPVTVRIPFPEGMKIQWAGELSSDGSGAGDTRKPITIKQGEGGPYAEFEFSNSTSGQLEALGATPTVSANRTQVNIEFVQSAPASLTAFSVRLPAGVSDVKISPSPAGAPATNPAGESLYTLPSKQLKTGGSAVVKVDYSTLPAETPFDTGGGSSSSGLVIGVLAALIAAALVVLVVAMRRQQSSATDESKQPDPGDE